jgi:hypothetical protein
MRAIVVGALGGPEVLQVLQVREVDRPSADPGETLIQVDRAGVNFSDIGRRRNGWNNPTQPLPVIPGFEVVGRRVSDGARVMPASLTLPVPEGARRTGTRPLCSRRVGARVCHRRHRHGLFFAPIANVVLSAVRLEEEGKASGANNAIRELGGELSRRAAPGRSSRGYAGSASVGPSHQQRPRSIRDRLILCTGPIDPHTLRRAR